jgi:hypothetical protein
VYTTALTFLTVVIGGEHTPHFNLPTVSYVCWDCIFLFNKARNLLINIRRRNKLVTSDSQRFCN